MAFVGRGGRERRPRLEASDSLRGTGGFSIAGADIIDGPCVGGGSLIAFGCDLRVATDRAFLAIPAGRLGLAYPHHGLERLVAVVGEACALDLLLTGRRMGPRGPVPRHVPPLLLG